MRPRQWVAVHRKHHAFTDENEDPHSPARLGWLRVQLTNPGLYRRVARDESQVARTPATSRPRGSTALVFDHALLGLGVGVVLLVLAFGWQIAVDRRSRSTWSLYLGLSGAVNSIAHTFGRRPFATSATNVQWLALLTAGEGLHNNHHAAPTSARFSIGRFEIDSVVVGRSGVLASFGWLTVRHDTPEVRGPAIAPTKV